MKTTELFDRNALLKRLQVTDEGESTPAAAPPEDQRELAEAPPSFPPQFAAARRDLPQITADEAQRRREDQKRADEEQRGRQALRQQADARRDSAAARSAILRGLQSGESIPALFLTACSALSSLTGDTAFLESAKRYTATVYGEALQQPEAADIAARQIEEQADAIERFCNSGEPLTDAERADLQTAITAHREKARRIRERAARNATESAQQLKG